MASTDPYRSLRTKDGKVAEHPTVRVTTASLDLDDYAADEPVEQMVRLSHRDKEHCAFLGDRVLLSFGGEYSHTLTLSGPLDVLERLVAAAAEKLAARRAELEAG